MSTVSTHYFRTVEQLLQEARTEAFAEVTGELERLCGQSYFTTYDLEPGLRIAISAVKRLVDSRNIRVADPAEEEWVDIWDQVPHAFGSTLRITRAPGVDAVCRACSKPYRRSAAGPFVCVHVVDCAGGKKIITGAQTTCVLSLAALDPADAEYARILTVLDSNGLDTAREAG